MWSWRKPRPLSPLEQPHTFYLHVTWSHTIKQALLGRMEAELSQDVDRKDTRAVGRQCWDDIQVEERLPLMLSLNRKWCCPPPAHHPHRRGCSRKWASRLFSVYNVTSEKLKTWTTQSCCSAQTLRVFTVRYVSEQIYRPVLWFHGKWGTVLFHMSLGPQNVTQGYTSYLPIQTHSCETSTPAVLIKPAEALKWSPGSEGRYSWCGHRSGKVTHTERPIELTESFSLPK